MHWQDDYLDYSYPYSSHCPSPNPERLRLLAYVDGRLVGSWTEPVHGTRWQRFADQFDEPAPSSSCADRESEAAYVAVGETLDRVAGEFLDHEARQLVRRELWLKQALHVPEQALARHLRGLDFHSEPRPRGCPDLASFACAELLTPTTRRTLIEWRDLALAAASTIVLPFEVES